MKVQKHPNQSTVVKLAIAMQSYDAALIKVHEAEKKANEAHAELVAARANVRRIVTGK